MRLPSKSHSTVSPVETFLSSIGDCQNRRGFITYPHIRYLARFWPLFLLLVLGTVERVTALEESRWRRTALAATAVFMALGLGTLGSRALYNLRHVAAFEHYWFPD